MMMMSTSIGALVIRFILMIVLSAYIDAYRKELSEYRDCKSDCNDETPERDCDQHCDTEINGYFKDNVHLRRNTGMLIFGLVVTVIYLVVSSIAIAVGICGFQAEDGHRGGDEELGGARPNPARVSPSHPPARHVNGGVIVAGTVIPGQPIIMEANVISVTPPQQQQAGSVRVVVQEPRSYTSAPQEPVLEPVASEVHMQRSKMQAL